MERIRFSRVVFFLFLLIFIIANSLNMVSAVNNYTVDIFFTVPNSVYQTNERIELKGSLYLGNYTTDGSLVTNSSQFANATINLTIRNTNGTFHSNYTFTTDTNGSFYSKSSFYSNDTGINASSVAAEYNIRTEYKDPSNKTWFSDIDISVVNKTVDELHVSPDKTKYNPSEAVKVEVEAIREIGDRILHISNVSVNGTIRNSSKGNVSNFNCTTGSNGKCTVNISAPSDYGYKILELNNYKVFSGFSVVPFEVNVYMKDELGKSLKNIYAGGEKARIEVSVLNGSSSDEYNFSGYIRDSSGNVLKTINSTQLNENNSFINTFQFTIDSVTFSAGAYVAFITINKTGDGSINSTTSFEVKEWTLSVDKRESGSGFEYGYSVFPNRTIYLEAFPKYRSNGSVIQNLSSSLFTITLEDNLNNIVANGNASWNSSCGNDGCYEFSMNSTNSTGVFTLYSSLSYEGNIQTDTKSINVIDGIMSAQTTDSEGNLKELFGANEYIYFSLTSKNETSSFNLSDAEIFTVSYMNGSEFNYTNVTNFSLVNYSNTNFEWAWNKSQQRIKLDTPSIGGLYNVFIFGNNKSIGTTGRFIINPYDVCSVPKDTPGSIADTSGFYYTWQFKTTDTVYLEMKIIQADNPLGRATALNHSTGNGTGIGSACTVDTSTQQVINNATINITEVRNLQSGAKQKLNTSETSCQSDDSSGGYTCTLTPLTKWDGGTQIVELLIEGQDGTSAISFSRFESRAFYMYGWSSTWQNSPESNITLNVQLYEAGSGWWGSSNGLSGTVTLKKIEYMGTSGDWLSTPVDSGFNVTNISTSVTSGQSSLTLPVANYPTGSWKTGNYRAVLEGVTNNGDTDYGYAWFGVKLWDVYGTPIVCTNSTCRYKNYFNSKENITLYIKISKAGSYNYNYNGGSDIWGNTSIGVKKIQDCQKWPCTELNSSHYNATTIYVNESSPWYWSATTVNESKYLLRINKTEGTWGTGYYSVVLNVNGTDTGRAWFNTIAFYVHARPTDVGGVNYTYSIKPALPKYYNVTVTKSYKGYNAGYNNTDFVNVSFEDLVLTTWDESTLQTKEYTYSNNELNVTPLVVNGSVLVNISYANGSWPTGYYWGRITYKNEKTNETSSGRLSFSVRPFRVSMNRNTNYQMDEEQCVNSTVKIYDPDWRTSTLLNGNYSLIQAYEDVWSSGSRSRVNLTNFSVDVSFNDSLNVSLCPNNGTWGNGNWGGYHYVNFVIRDNSDNSTAKGGSSFRANPFKIQWGSVGGGSTKLKNANIVVQVNVSNYVSGATSSANLSSIYQWRYDQSFRGKQTYVFKIAGCYSNVSSQCNVTGLQNVTIYPPSEGWKTGYNYFTTEWNKVSDASSKVTDWSGVSIDSRDPYNGYFSNSDNSGNWKNKFFEDENVTIKINTRDDSYNNINVTITDVSYSLNSGNCYNEFCRSYTSATWSLVEGGTDTDSDGIAIIHLKTPSGNWTKGNYDIRASVSAANGTANISGGYVTVTDNNFPNITLTSPLVNQTFNGSTFDINFTTTETADCYFWLYDYGSFNSSYCGSNSSSSNSTVNERESCNETAYNFNVNTTYHQEYVSDNYHSVTHGSSYSYWSRSESTGFTTDSTIHGYRYNTTNKVTNENLITQDYGIYIICWDLDWNSKSEFVAFNINVTTNASSSNPGITINSPVHGNFYNLSNMTFNYTINKNGTCEYSLNNGTTNVTMNNVSANSREWNATNTSIGDGFYYAFAYCNDTFGNNNYTTYANFTIDTVVPNISYSAQTPANNSNLTQDYIYVNVSYADANLKNISYYLFNSSGGRVNVTVYKWPSVANYRVNWTNLSYGNYTYNVTIIDSAGHKNSTGLRFVNLSAEDSLNVTINSPFHNAYYNSGKVTINITLNKNGTCEYSFNNGTTNFTMNNVSTNSREWNATNTSIADGDYYVYAYCNDTLGNNNWTSFNNFTIDTVVPNISYGTLTDSNNSNVSRNYIAVNVSIADNNFGNITYRLWYSNGTLLNTTIKTVNTIASKNLNWTNLADNTYRFNVTFFDRANNSNTTSIRAITVDASPPNISYGLLTNANNTNLTKDYIFVNVSINETNFLNMTFLLMNTSGTVNSSNFTVVTYSINWTSTSYGNYTYNVTVRDAAGNKFTSPTRYINLSAA